MDIVFACPRCQHVMQAPDDKAGTRTQCQQCRLPFEVPLPKGKLIEVRSAELVGAAAASPPTHANGPRAAAPRPASLLAATPPTRTVADGRLRADELLKQASARRDAGELDAAIRLLHNAYEEILQANALFPVEDFLRLPIYLHQAGRPREAWKEFNTLLFQGYPNQARDVILIAQDRSKIFDKMRLFLEADGKPDIAAVFGIFALVCKGIKLHHEGRARELRTWFSKSACTDFVRGLKAWNGNLGKLQGIQYAVVGELGEYPSIDFDLLAQRIDVTLRS